MNLNSLKSVLVASTFLVYFQASAQLHIGLSANIGNKLSYTPDSPNLKTPAAISGSLVLALEQKFKNDWFLQYGVDIGVLGYIIKYQYLDTTSAKYDPDIFGNYSSVYGNLGISGGKEIRVGSKKLMLGLGGGLSFYFPNWVSVTSVGYSGDESFISVIDGPISTAQPFVRVIAQLKLNPKVTVGLGYTHHFKSILEGEYEINETETPSSGTIALYPKELNLAFMYRISGEKTVSGQHYTYRKNKTYLGFEFSVANDLFKISDNGNYLIAVPLWNTPIGLNIRQEINQKMFIETGLIWKQYWDGYGFNTFPYYNSSTSDVSIILPVRYGININLHKEKVYLVPVIGYSFGINPPFGFGYGYGTETSNTTVIHYNETENPDVSRYFSLLQTGLGLDFRVFRTMLLSLSANYYSGFNEITKIDIEYTVNNVGPYIGTAISKGEFWCISTSLKYPISNFWTREKAE